MTAYTVTLTSTVTVEFDDESCMNPAILLKKALREVDLETWRANADIEEYFEEEEEEE